MQLQNVLKSKFCFYLQPRDLKTRLAPVSVIKNLANTSLKSGALYKEADFSIFCFVSHKANKFQRDRWLGAVKALYMKIKNLASLF